MPGGRGRAVRLLRRARASPPSRAARSWSRSATPTCRAWTTSSAARARTACRGCGGSARPSCARSSRRRPASPRCTRRRPGIVDFAAVAAAYARDVEALGGEVRTGVRRARRRRPPRRRRVVTRDGVSEALARAVCCAGAWSDRLAVALAARRTDLRILPFRGAYLKLRADRTPPRPRPDLPGARPVAAVPRRAPLAHDRRRRPARADRAAGRRPRRLRPHDGPPRRPRRHAALAGHRAARAQVVAHRRARARQRREPPAARPRPRALRPGHRPWTTSSPDRRGSGLRPSARDGALLDDFAFAETAHALHVLNAPSPAATASLAIAAMVADRLP